MVELSSLSPEPRSRGGWSRSEEMLVPLATLTFCKRTRVAQCRLSWLVRKSLRDGTLNSPGVPINVEIRYSTIHH